MMFLATRGDHASVIVVTRHDVDAADADATVWNSIELMKQGNPTYAFSDPVTDGSQYRF